MASVELSRRGNAAYITLNEPRKRNALDSEGMFELNDYLHDVQYEDDIRVVVITGANEAYCAGADIDERADDDLPDMAADVEAKFHEAIRVVMRMKKPVISKVRGPAVGAGASLATASDFVYAAEDAIFGWAFINIGITVDCGVSFILPRLVGVRKAMELATYGELIDAHEAADLGLINEVVPEDELDDRVEEAIAELGSGPTRAIGELKRLLLRGSHMSIEEVLDAEAAAQGYLFETEDRIEGMRAFQQSREPDFQGR